MAAVAFSCNSTVPIMWTLDETQRKVMPFAAGIMLSLPVKQYRWDSSQKEPWKLSKRVVAIHHSIVLTQHNFWSYPTVPGLRRMGSMFMNRLRSIVVAYLPTDANILLATPQVRGLYPVFSDYGFISSLICQKFCCVTLSLHSQPHATLGVQRPGISCQTLWQGLLCLPR